MARCIFVEDVRGFPIDVVHGMQDSIRARAKQVDRVVTEGLVWCVAQFH